jgi:hypothetical protein
MRGLKCVLAVALLSPFAVSTAATAQAPNRLPCDGTYNVVRISDVKPGMMATFEKAVMAQKAWYKQAGTKDEISLMRIADPKSGSYSETEAITTHTSVNGAPTTKQDAAYDAFVAMFKESSTIKTQYFTCVK